MIATPDRPSFAATRQRESALLEPRPLADLLAAYRGLIDTGPATEPRLRAALDHVLGNPGSLLRAQLAFHLLHSHGFEAPRARAVAVAIEYFHTASLVFDDMPAMDDADERRGAPCVHHRFDEATATLAALALINRAYALLWQVLGTLPGPARDAAAQLVGECLGAQGILSGQSRDLQFEASPRREHDVLAVAEGKTVTLIRLTLLLPLSSRARPPTPAPPSKNWPHAGASPTSSWMISRISC